MENLLNRYRKLVANYQWADSFVKWSFISAVSAVLERKVWLNEQGLGYLYPNLYLVFVGPPASRKTTTANLPVRLFIKHLPEPLPFCSNQVTPAALIEELKASSGASEHQHSSPLYVVSGEFGVWIKDFGGGSMVDLLLEFYDSRLPGEFWQKNTIKHGFQKIKNPAISIIGCTTAQDLVEAHLVRLAQKGVISRFLFVCHPHPVPGVSRYPELDKIDVEELRIQFERIQQIKGEFKMTPEALDLYDIIYSDIQSKIIEVSGSTIIESYFARKEVQIKKTAMCVSAMRDSSRVITAEDLELANRLIQEIEPNMMYAFKPQIIKDDPNLASKILDKLYVGRPLTASELVKNFHNSGEIMMMDPYTRHVLASLVESGRVKSNINNGVITYEINSTKNSFSRHRD